jgi:hypothetical protein
MNKKSPINCCNVQTVHKILVRWKPLITTSVYATPLYRQMFCGTNEFPTAKHNIMLLGQNNTCLQRDDIFGTFHDVITDKNKYLHKKNCKIE